MDIKGFSGEHRWLSNFYVASFTFIGQQWQTVEHCYQAMKCANPCEGELIRQLATPGQAKRAGRKAVLRDDWEEIKLFMMQEIVRRKFSSNPELADKLLATGDGYLEETNTWNDTFWGVCNGVGENHLGIILMQIRDDIRHEIEIMDFLDSFHDEPEQIFLF